MHNLVYIIGRLVKDFEIDESKKEQSITIAVQRMYKNEDGIYDTDFIPCKLNMALTNNASKYLHKGDLIGIKGVLEYRDSELFVIIDKMSFLSSKKD